MPKSEKLSIKSDTPGGRLFLLGNEAIARGAIEAGVQVMAAYPGTPSTEIAETLMNLAPDFNLYAEWSVNEKVAFGVAVGAALCGVRAMAVMKHVGVNVALDSLMTAAYMGTTGGLVIVEAEDPGQWSSQGEQDNRLTAEQTYLPMLEPASVQEALEMTRDAFKLSEEFQQPIFLRSVTRLGHARADVTLGKIHQLNRPGIFKKDPSNLVYLPAAARKGRRQMVARFNKIRERVDSLPYNQLKITAGARLGIITSGIAHSYVLDALNILGLKDQVSVLKIGTAFPLPEKLIKKILLSVPDVLIIEELEPFIENHVRVIAQIAGINVDIRGKGPVPLIGELTPRKVTEVIAHVTATALPVDFAAIDQRVREVEPLLPYRPPSLCPGCPHRASHYAIKMACEEYQRETGIEPLKPGDIGCNALGSNSPLNGVDVATCMGGGFDLANGIARVSDVPIIAHLGDSTFFHSGMAPMVNAVYNRARITMIVLDNLTTAMTGSQPSPSTGTSSRGEPTLSIRPEAIARACGIQFVEIVDPNDFKRSRQVLAQALKFKGPSFIVFRSPCAILDQRDKRARGEKIQPHQINQEKCLANALPFCTAACPLHIDVRGYVKLIAEGDYDAALKLVKAKLPFPGIVGRVCTHPCETKCQRGEVDESIAIAALKRSAADFGRTDNEDLIMPVERPEKVAVIGGGPAGLMAAYDLRKAGYQVTVFEALPVLGGMLSVGIPEYRLPRSISLPELERIQKMGVAVRLNTRIGQEIEFSSLRKIFAAVVIAAGAHRAVKLNIENCDLPDVISGTDFLRDVNLGRRVLAKERVAIIGGGNTAVDCARTYLKLVMLEQSEASGGAGFKKEVNLVYRRDKPQMPAIVAEINEAAREGVKFTFLANPVKIVAESGRVIGLECTRTRLGPVDAGGRARPEPVAGSNFIIPADLVIAAIGEEPDLDFLTDSGLTAGRLLQADPLTLATNVPGVFAAGDVASGPATVIEALAAGRKAAISVDRYLNGQPLDVNRQAEGSQVSSLIVDINNVIKEKRQTVPTLAPGLRHNLKEIELGFNRNQAIKEAARCLACGCEQCIKLLGCPAIGVIEGEVTIDRTQCPGCGLCAQICPAQAIGPEVLQG